MLSGPRESFVGVHGWHRGMRDRLVVDWGRGGAPQPAVEDLVGAPQPAVEDLVVGSRLLLRLRQVCVEPPSLTG